MLRKLTLAATILAVPTFAIAQVQSGVQSGVQGGVQSGVRSGFDYRPAANDSPRQRRSPYYSSCWRTTVTRGVRTVWNCQPVPPP
jgi:ribosomal protein L37AE/L43A